MANAAKDELLPPDIARIKQAHLLRVALTRQDYPPFYFQEDGSADGHDIVLARDIARRLGVEIEFVRQAESWNGVIRQIEAGEADVAISALSRTLARAQRVAYTQPYFTLQQALLVNRMKLAGLGGERSPLRHLNESFVQIGTLSGSSYIGFSRTAFPAAQIVPYARWNDAIHDLQAGEIHALMFDSLLCRRSLLAEPQNAIHIQLVLTERPDYVAMAVNWRDRELLRWLNVYIDTVRSEGLLQQLKSRYLEMEREDATD